MISQTSVCVGDLVLSKSVRCSAPTADEGSFFVGVHHLDSDDHHLRRWATTTTEQLPPTFRFRFERGDFLFPTRRPALRKGAIAPVPGLTGEKILVLTGKPNGPLKEALLPYLLGSTQVKDWAQKRAIGSVTPHFRWGDLASCPVVLPPMKEQGRLVALFQRLDDYAESLRHLSVRGAASRDALAHAIFGSLECDSTLGAAIDQLYSGGTPSRRRAEFWNGSVPWLSPKDMKTREILSTADCLTDAALEERRVRLVPRNTLFVVVRGMILAHTFPVCLAGVEMAFNQDVKALMFPTNVSARFAQAWLSWLSPRILAAVSETSHGTKRLETDVLLKQPWPTIEFSEQEEMVEKLHGVEQLVAAAAKRRTQVLDLLWAMVGERLPAGGLT